MITYEDIKKANENIKTLPIERKNKDGTVTSKYYAEVNQRIMAFRSVFPEGFIETILLHDGTPFKEMTVCHFKAEVGFHDGDQRIVLGTGHAYEEKNANFINKTSFIENCETSAVGRALGMAGFGIDGSLSSYDEVTNAIENQQSVVKASESQVAILKEKYTGENLKKLLTLNGIDRIEDISMEKASDLIKRLGGN